MPCTIRLFERSGVVKRVVSCLQSGTNGVRDEPLFLPRPLAEFCAEKNAEFLFLGGEGGGGILSSVNGIFLGKGGG